MGGKKAGQAYDACELRFHAARLVAKVDWKGKMDEEYYLRVPMKRDLDCDLYVSIRTVGVSRP